MFLLSRPTADWMLLDMQYCHACGMYKSSRDADSSGRKLSEVGSWLAQCKNCSEAVEVPLPGRRPRTCGVRLGRLFAPACLGGPVWLAPRPIVVQMSPFYC
jgi:hypothetical protein